MRILDGCLQALLMCVIPDCCEGFPGCLVVLPQVLPFLGAWISPPGLGKAHSVGWAEVCRPQRV